MTMYDTDLTIATMRVLYWVALLAALTCFLAGRQRWGWSLYGTFGLIVVALWTLTR